MSVLYKAVQWNRHKLIYDAILLVSVVLYVLLFISVTKWLHTDLDLRALRIRAYGSAAFILLHVILSIGPLTRLNPRFFPLLYNRRHMGVTMFLLGLYHARLALMWYHNFGNLDPMVSLFLSNTHYDSFIRFPFEILGLLALPILFLMAATSHDFWLVNLTAPVWKALHMGVYLAYGLLVGHVVLGALQTNKDLFLSIIVGLGLFWIVGVHLAAAIRESSLDHQALAVGKDGFIDVGSVTEIPERRAKIVSIGGERVAVFRYDGKISAVSNVCQHQNGPLGEGKIVEGCITCPWHGYQYLPDSGTSPPPFTEKIPTFAVKLQGERIFVKAVPNPAGTQVAPAVIGEGV
ncbi:MAG: Rieske 2Fe-2S domain-containing protein [Cyanothece sp. SIO1E1]|nr:Rieske 2Fe-2S domain-containing protein [Cyanothece sp. SIO1E1]